MYLLRNIVSLMEKLSRMHGQNIFVVHYISVILYAIHVYMKRYFNEDRKNKINFFYIYGVHKNSKNKKIIRRFEVHALFTERSYVGAFGILFGKLKEYPEKF